MDDAGSFTAGVLANMPAPPGIIECPLGTADRAAGTRRAAAPRDTRPLVSVVDDDESIRESLPDLLKELGFDVCAFASAEEFLASDCFGPTQCLIVDVAMPGMSGPDLQLYLTQHGHDVPIVFITAHGDGVLHPRLRERGAECLLKPFSETALLDALQRALQTSPALPRS